jgi:hypothetical protein
MKARPILIGGLLLTLGVGAYYIGTRPSGLAVPFTNAADDAQPDVRVSETGVVEKVRTRIFGEKPSGPKAAAQCPQPPRFTVAPAAGGGQGATATAPPAPPAFSVYEALSIVGDQKRSVEDALNIFTEDSKVLTAALRKKELSMLKFNQELTRVNNQANDNIRAVLGEEKFQEWRAYQRQVGEQLAKGFGS